MANTEDGCVLSGQFTSSAAQQSTADCNLGEDAVHLLQPVTTDVPESFWNSTQSNDFLTLQSLAVKLLIIFATSASVERLFSVAEGIIRTRCNRLSASSVESVSLRIQVTE